MNRNRPKLSPRAFRARAHPECNAWCRGTRHALVVWHFPSLQVSVAEGIQSVADDFDAALVSFQEASEPKKPEPLFDSYGDTGTVPDASVAYLCFFQWEG